MTTPRKLLMTLVAVMLAATATPLVLAQGGNSTTGQSHAPDHPSPRALNETEREQRHSELSAAREAALASFKENRTKALEAFHAKLNATRASFLENKTRVIDECKAAHNATKGNESADHCVRDGLKPLIESAHAQIRDAQQAFRAAMEAARDAAKAAFAAHRHDINVKHGQPDA